MKISGNENILKGWEAERYAETYLLNQGLILLERNYRCRFGEIDLVMQARNDHRIH